MIENIIKKYSMRKVTDSDIFKILKWRNHLNVRSFMINNSIIKKTEHLHWYKNAISTNTNELIIFSFNNIDIGFGSISKIDKINKNCTWGMYLKPDQLFLSHGVFLEIILINRMFYFHKISKIYGQTLSNNKAVLKIHKLMSFNKEGILKKQIFRNNHYLDLIITSLFKSDWENNDKFIFKTIGSKKI